MYYKYIHIYVCNTCIIYMQCVLEGLISVNEHLRGEPHKSEVLIASTLLVMKAHNVYQNQAITSTPAQSQL